MLLPIAGGGVAWLAGRSRPQAAWWIALLTLVLETGLLLVTTLTHPAHAGPWRAHFSMPWIPALGIAIRLDMDGLSLSLIWLSLVLGLACVFLATRRVTGNAGAFHFLLLAALRVLSEHSLRPTCSYSFSCGN